MQIGMDQMAEVPQRKGQFVRLAVCQFKSEVHLEKGALIARLLVADIGEDSFVHEEWIYYKLNIFFQENQPETPTGPISVP